MSSFTGPVSQDSKVAAPYLRRREANWQEEKHLKSDSTDADFLHRYPKKEGPLPLTAIGPLKLGSVQGQKSIGPRRGIRQPKEGEKRASGMI